MAEAPKRKRDKHASEQALKAAALKLFSEKGFFNATTRDLSEATGLSKGVLYWHFSSKEEIAFSLISDMLRDFLERIEQARDEQGPVVERFRRLAADVAELYYTETDYLRLLWKFRADRRFIFSEEYNGTVMSYYRRMRETLQDLIRQGIEQGELKKVDPKKLSFIFLGVTEGLEVEWLENEEEFSMREALPETLDMILESIKR